MGAYNIIEKKVVNGKKTERVVNNEPLPLGAAVMATELIVQDIEGNDKVFGNYRTDLVNKGTPQENYKFGWDGDADYELIKEQMGWGVAMVDNENFELSYNIVETDGDPLDNQDAFICINTAACADWATTDEPLIQMMKTREDFKDLGFDEDYERCQKMLHFTIKRDFDYDGVYVIRYITNYFV